MAGLKNLKIINPPRDRVAVHITESASDTKMIDCDVEGGIKNEGEKTLLLRTKIRNAKNENPLMFWIAVAGVLLGIPGAIAAALTFF